MMLFVGFTIAETDRTDTAELRAWWEVYDAAQNDRPYALWSTWEEAEKLWATPPPGRDAPMWTASDDGRVVGAARALLPLDDNTHLAMVEAYVRPEARRRGVGRALVELMERVGVERGRTTFLADAYTLPGGTSDGLSAAGALGYPQVALEELKLADLVATEPTWAMMEDEAAARLAPYTLVEWVGRTPAGSVDDVCHLYTRFLAEIPLEGLDLGVQRWDAARLDAVEQRREDAGFVQLMVAGRAPSGELVGYSNALVTPSGAEAYIDGTLVLPEHRGHALGLAMKVRLHRMLRERHPDCPVIITGNAGVNEHMNAVNDRLGYRVVEHGHSVQKVLSGPGSASSSLRRP